MEKIESVYKSKILNGGSVAFGCFVGAHQRLLGFYDFISTLANHRDEGFRRANEYFLEYAQSDAEKKSYQKKLDEGSGQALKTFADRFGSEITNNIVVGSVNNFLNFVSDLLSEIYLKHPEKIIGSLKIPLEIAYNFENRNELLSWAVERKISELTYQSLKDLRDFLNREYSFKIISDQSHFDQLSTLVNIRNLIVHNRGVVNYRFLSLEGDKFGEYGKKLNLNFDNAFDGADLILQTSITLDDEAISKINLEKR